MKRLLFSALAALLIFTSVPSLASANSSTSLVSAARSYLGIPYAYGGSSTSGFDCSGYTQAVFKKVGINIPRSTGQQYSTGTAVSKSNLQTGDLVFFNTNGRGVSHVGIYIGSNNFIHSATSKGVSIASINDPYYWGKRYIGAKRVTSFSGGSAVASAATPQPSYATRAQVAETLVKKLGLTRQSSESHFSDVNASHPKFDVIVAASDAGIFSGNSAGNFSPDQSLTRAELAKVLVSAFDLEISSNTYFKDVPSSHWAHDYVSTLYTNNVTKGYSDQTFKMNDKVTLKELELFIQRLQ